ncbi:MAG TPA: bifunctional phosphoribosyl-AMP cyclohydrolase/phosphoribosyl-ATP diphosphatase HisIE [Gemmatimonadaceae bacterium]|jgi:phosphoribosyl-ATP pyrophosphohydrolase/phosphoribosyl-AMP cyclohydrolase|nr:bifunctional phosphoribosyl-AMP cyclohydrolase/phosphoribosyl-ATP diphosphatase HisIE [Gemmatimonadaceae bacterium]
MTSLNLDDVKFGVDTGTVVVVAQDAATGRVLMVAHADREALSRTIETGEMHYRSRRRGLWRKGATSGNIQKVVSLALDCDGDSVLARVIPAGPACHTGQVSCFPDLSQPSAWALLAETIRKRRNDPDNTGYTRALLGDRNLRLKKIGEEAAEFVTACADSDAARAVEEAADVVYHMAVALEALDTSIDDVALALFERSPNGNPSH